MSLVGRALGIALKLPPAQTHDVIVERDLKVPMPDGAVLLADRYYPRGGEKLPTILIRSPYGRASLLGKVFALPFAERGFQALIQSCRGTFGSGGDFDPFRNERADGLATVEWMKKQPWFSGKFATIGPSYVGFVQWAIAAEVGPELAAMSLQVTTSDFQSPMYHGGSFWLDTALTWLVLVDNQEKSPLPVFLSMLRSERVVRAAAATLPIREADRAAIGKTVPFYQDWIAHTDSDDAWWNAAKFNDRVASVRASALLLGGFYDIFLPQTLADYQRLRAAGASPYLTIGPWSHTNGGWFGIAIRESLAWFRAHLLSDLRDLRALPVRVFVMGSRRWKNFAEWPPPGYIPTPYYLHKGSGLSTRAPDPSDPDYYRYDPANPTPSVGGSSLSDNSGPKDNRALESRHDVLVYSTPPLDNDIEAIGPVTAKLYVKSSLEHTDFFVRLCDVDPAGRSINLSDGFLRLEPPQTPDADGVRSITVELWPTAALFKRGHRIRIQVSSGAHPRYARNPGTGEPLATATRLVAAEQRVYHDPAHPSAILLPVAASRL